MWGETTELQLIRFFLTSAVFCSLLPLGCSSITFLRSKLRSIRTRKALSTYKSPKLVVIQPLKRSEPTSNGLVAHSNGRSTMVGRYHGP